MRTWAVLALPLLSLPLLAGCLITDDASISEPVELAAPSVDTLTAELLAQVEVAEAMVPVLEDLTDGEVTVDADPAYLLPGDPRGGVVQADLVLQPSDLLTNTTWLEVDGERHPMPAMQVYEGHLKGDEDSQARLTVTPQWARGTVRIDDVSYRVRINMEGNFPIGTELRDDYEEEAFHHGLAAPAPPTFDRNGMEPHDCLSLVPDTMRPQTDAIGPSSNEEMNARIILDADALYGMTLGPHTVPMMVAMLAEVDAIYEHQTGLRFQIMGLHAHTNETAMPDPADEAPLGNLSAYWNARNDPRDMVHLYTGYPSSYAQANCIGGAGMPELAYTFTTIHWASESSGKMRHEQTYAHELGHILNAHHHYGNPVEGGVSTTIMHQGGEKVHPVFSWMSRSVIRGWAENHLGQHDPGTA